ncbi:MAG: GNAT family N-acetyltransferase [Granulosicoccus sp.]
MTEFVLEYTVGKSESSKMDEIFMLGYDAWADGLSTEAYLKNCQTSEKYQQGTWHVLEKKSVVVSALIIYENRFNLPGGSYGIGSVATLPSLRKTGLAHKLIQHVIDTPGLHKKSPFYLFSDINRLFYEKLRFAAVIKHKSLMRRVGKKADDRAHDFNAIEYF